MKKELEKRSGNKCELCQAGGDLIIYTVSPKSGSVPEDNVILCNTCFSEISENNQFDRNHWRCLNEAIWSDTEAVKVVSYRLLNQLSKSESWATELLEMMYLDDETLKWAQEGSEKEMIVHHDSNGVVLNAGDTVTLIKDLKVKGGGFTAKRGTAVRNIRLVHDNPEHIEGKVEGQSIIILTQYVKK